MLLLRSLALAVPSQGAPNTAVVPITPDATANTADFATRLAESGNVYRQFTCQLEKSIDVTCPGVEVLAALNAQEALLKVPANEKWLFYGPSYMLQLFQTIVTANRAEIVEEGSIVEEDTEFQEIVRPRPPSQIALALCAITDCASPSLTTLASLHPDAMRITQDQNIFLACEPGERADATASDLLQGPRDAGEPECNRADADSGCETDTVTQPAVRYKLSNGGEIYGINNSPVFQNQARPDSLGALKKFLTGDLALTRIWYMEPHGDNYYAEHCAAQKEGRDVDPDAIMDEERRDMCYKHDSPPVIFGKVRADTDTSTTAEEYVECAINRPAYKLFYEHVAAKKTKSMMIVVPWAVSPENKAPANPTIEYRAYAVGNKYACVAGGSAPGQLHYGLGRGPCYPGYISQHPCTTICVGTSCSPGPAVKMAIDMVQRAQGVITPEDFTGFTAPSPAIVMKQRACDGCPGCPADHEGCDRQIIATVCPTATGVKPAEFMGPQSPPANVTLAALSSAPSRGRGGGRNHTSDQAPKDVRWRG